MASLDIGRVLADRDGVTFRAAGTCMYPVVRQGDVLRIRSCRAADVAVGDIAVCRGADFMFSHRVIFKGERDGHAFIVTRPDRSSGGGDAPTFDENLLGVVMTITRRGRTVPLAPAATSWLARRWYALCLALIEAAPRLKLRLLKIVASVQSQQLYQTLARRWFALSRPRLEYRVSVPLNATLGDTVVRQVALEEFDPAALWQGRPLERWTLSLFLNSSRKPAAWISLSRGAGEEWRIERQGARVRYGGLGLEELLAQQARHHTRSDLSLSSN